jgi:8-oxo-dGTP diphosphatase
VFLIRHASAGSRSRWAGDDLTRPLSGRGRRQADAIAELLAGRRVTRVVSSPATRCVETVEPLATARGLSVVIDKRLAEGESVAGFLDVVRKSNHQAICAHGDLIPEVMQVLLEQGLRAKAARRCQKGSVWEVHWRSGKPTEATYHPPAA